ncbi:hypothetical protein [Brachybacterium sp. ACRRE]|uniref:hypothetical protein n=1 Tax=Brachybacterium sp. ACRRE TaxID=2918184 RepID=UPI001EF35960|nr:hypothetical protein [Brachybacterium sp. ACRRE]MCG7311289.1 hypothetical protein [Brachybacterium sp. ACRRE]
MDDASIRHPSDASEDPSSRLRRSESWQARTLAHVEAALPGAEVTVHGSARDPADLDPWSDLDVRIVLDAPVDVEAVLGAPIWAFQHSRTDGRTVVRTVVRTVLVDGRAVDLSVDGGPVVLPETAPDGAIRFDAALAASRFGRGSELIGLHLTLGIVRETLVQGMLLADRREGTDHHRFAMAQDARARETLAVVDGPLTPRTALAAYLQYGRWRRELDPSYRPDATGLEALIRRGNGGRIG